MRNIPPTSIASAFLKPPSFPAHYDLGTP
ncbi:uncharacterized protein G2W53_003202 [Senna tora]|uniref:Uncharacterized protein n=1 Tax=Senna tora TaxID=362788 RepID=A0A834XB69_9FABA|nr:uncharacterized protein G2W53_003202 [Senna tora]